MILGTCLGVPQRVLFECFLALLGPKTPKNTRQALFGALRGKCPKALEKHSVGHFPAWAPEHSCKRRPGSQENPLELIKTCADSRQAKGGVWNGGGWNRQISAPEIYFSGPEISGKFLVLLVRRRIPQEFQALKFHNSGPEIWRSHPPPFHTPSFACLDSPRFLAPELLVPNLPSFIQKPPLCP